MADKAPARENDTRTPSSTDRDPGRHDSPRVGAAGAGPGQDAAAGSGTRAKTSVAAVFALVFGLIALLAALTGLLAPVAVILGLIGLVLGIVGMRAGKKPHTTGKGVAIGGLVLAVLALLLGIAALIGAATVVSSNPQILDQISNLVTNARNQIPTG